MKKFLFLLLVVSIMLMMCACKEKNTDIEPNYVEENQDIEESQDVEEEQDENYEEEEVFDFDDLLASYLENDFSDIDVKIGNDSFESINLKYAKEYYNILKPLESEEESYNYRVQTVQNKNGKFPILLIKKADELLAYEFDGNKANEISAEGMAIDEEKAPYYYSATSIFENTIIEQGDLFTRYQEIKQNSKSIEDIINDYKNDEDGIFYGSCYTSYEDFEVPDSAVEQSSNIFLSEDNKLCINVSDSSTKLDETYEIKGIDGEVVYGIIEANVRNNAATPDAIYLLTDKAEVYTLDIEGAKDSVVAKKVEGLNNVVSIDSLYDYPAFLPDDNTEMISRYYAFTVDGVEHLLP